jgi:hypothetical protein
MRAVAVFRDAAWLTADRARAYGLVLSMALAAMACWIIVNRFMHAASDHRPIDDFMTFLAAGDMVRDGQAAAVYHMEEFTKALSHYADMGEGRLPFLYPPIMLVLCGWINHLPEPAAYAAFELLALIPLLISLYALLPKRWVILPLLTAPAVLMNFGSGQTGFFPAAAYAMAAVLMEKRPGFAGAALALLLFKPHFALLVPLALACARQWRAFFACGASAAALSALSLLAFPAQVWMNFFNQPSLMKFMLEHGTNILLSVDPFGAMRAAGASISSAYAAQAAVSAMALVLVVTASLRRPPGAAHIAIIAAGSLLFTPYAQDYDLGVALTPLAWMVASAERDGWRPWEKAVTVLTYLLPLAVRVVVITTAIQPAPFVLLGLLVLVWQRMMRSGAYRIQAA